MRATPSHRTLLVLAAALILAACPGENHFASAPLVNDTPVYRAVGMIQESPDGEFVDLLSLGAVFTLRLDDEAREFRSTFDFAATHSEVTGSFDISEGRITFSDDPFLEDTLVSDRVLEFERDGDRIFLRDLTGGLDLDGDGIREPAELRVILLRD